MKKVNWRKIIILIAIISAVIILVFVVGRMAGSGSIEKDANKAKADSVQRAKKLGPADEQELYMGQNSITFSDLQDSLLPLRKQIAELQAKQGSLTIDSLLASPAAILPILALTVLLLICLYKINKLDARATRQRTDLDLLKENIDFLNGVLPKQGTFNQPPPDASEIKKQLEQVIKGSERINELQSNIEQLGRDFASKFGKPVTPPVLQLATKTEVKPPQEDVFYMSGPVNNYFPTTAKSFNREDTVYKFTIKGNKLEALFEIHTSGAPLAEIIRMAESYIKPACDEENTPNFRVRNIENIKAGLCILEGDKWVIKNKALIRYE